MPSALQPLTGRGALHFPQLERRSVNNQSMKYQFFLSLFQVWKCTLCYPSAGNGVKSNGSGLAREETEKWQEGKEKEKRDEKEEVSEEVMRAREFLQLYSRGEGDSNEIFGDTSYIKSNKFPLRLRPGMPEKL